ncbi:MAG: ABC transporter ATP-binding protein [Bacteroidales bacterium]|jgi:ABC-2 type transport system ATP-binding protein|nr:ABC transporter ATP-binding protein [Bacteroidales bacterium]
MIQLVEISKAFGSHVVLDRLSFTFEDNKVYGIVGKNGSGKTTLFHCMTGLESCKGEIVSERRPLKNHIGYLPTELFFYKLMTGMEYVQFVCNARNQKIENIAARNIFELPLNDYISTYSTGMKKKLALFAILLQDVPYYIFDEPFNGIDFQSSVLVFDIIKALKQRGKTVIMSSHIYTTLTQTCDEICLLEDGNFKQQVLKADFDALEKSMHQEIVGNALDLLG